MVNGLQSAMVRSEPLTKNMSVKKCILSLTPFLGIHTGVLALVYCYLSGYVIDPVMIDLLFEEQQICCFQNIITA